MHNALTTPLVAGLELLNPFSAPKFEAAKIWYWYFQMSGGRSGFHWKVMETDIQELQHVDNTFGTQMHKSLYSGTNTLTLSY